MKEKCYISSTRTTHKHLKKEIIGPCGPCSFINLVKLNGSFELEKQLAKSGRLKPFHASDYSSFLRWGNEFKKDLLIFTSSRKLTEKQLSLMAKHEKVPKEKVEEYKKIAREEHNKIDKKFSKHIRGLKNPLQKLNELLKQKYQIAVLTSGFYFSNPIPHWIVAFKKEKNKYWFLDSVNGIISLTKEQLKKGWEINKQQGFCAQLIAYKNMKICAIGDPHGNLKKVKKIPLKDIDLILINGDLGKADIAREFAFKNLALRNKGLPELEYDSKKVKEVYMEIYSSMTSLLKYLVKFAPVYSLLGNLGGDMMKDKIVKKEEKEYKIKLPYLGREIKKNKRISFDSK